MSWPEPSDEPLPLRFAAAVELVARDLQQPTPIPLEFRWTPPATEDRDEMCTVWARVRGGEGLGGWTLPAWTDDAGLLYWYASWLQDEVCETYAFWAQARPPCPGHAHPARPELLGEEAWWVCPADERRLARIGSL